MGLGFTYDGEGEEGNGGPKTPGWSYGGFAVFRRRIEKEIGQEIGSTTGDLAPLMNHSDCEGELTPQECAQVSIPLRGIMSRWREKSDNPDDDYDIYMGKRLVACMEWCAKRGVLLWFC